MKYIFTRIWELVLKRFYQQLLKPIKYSIIALVILLFLGSNATGSKFTCQPPTAGGIFTISLKSFTDKCEGIQVNIPAGSTAAQKATLIAARINASCAGVFTATATGDEVEVLNSVHPGQRVFFKFGPDATGEKDKIEESLQPGWWDWFWGATAPIYTCASSASGMSYDGVNPGKIYIGTSTYVATVQTYFGESPFNILNDARVQLMANGLLDVMVAEVSPGVWGLSFRGQPTDTFVEFGDDDTGADCVFEMFEPPSIQLHQLDFAFDGTVTLNSEWGVVDLEFVGFENIMYLNLTIDTAWVIENMPVMTTRGFGLMQSQRFWFDIGIPGIPVGSLTYGLTLTPTIFGRPATVTTSMVTPDMVRINSGFAGGPPGGGGPGPAGKQKGGQALDPAPKLHQNFPNQESPPNYCVPAGVSNSLQWLNTKNGLGMNAADISINSLGTAFGTTPGNGTVRSTIYPNKKNYCKRKKLPITTRKFSGSRIADVAKEIKNGQDVELMVSWIGQGGKGHCVAVTGITDHGNGKFSLVITHDKDQNQNGGTVDENATYDKNTKKWGGALANASGQSGDIMYLVECPVVKSKQSSNNLPGGTSHKIVTDARMTYDNGKYHIMNLDLGGYNNNNPPPPLHSSIFFSVFSLASLEMSIDSGLTFQQFNAQCQMFMRVHHGLDSAGIQYFQTEMIQLSLQGGSLPNGLIIRESPLPADSSTGSMRMRMVPGGFQIDSFFDVFTDLSLDGGSSWLPDDNGTTVLYADGPAALPFLELQNVIVGENETDCYDATQTIYVGGGSPFTILPGGNVTMIAGHSILFYEGTTVYAGGTLHGYITIDGQYCSDPPQIPMTSPVALGNESEAVPEIGSTPYVRVYPNPAYESVIVELTVNDPTGILTLEIIDMNGLRVAVNHLNGERRQEVSLTGLKAGVYFIHVISGNHAETVKLVRL